MDKSSFLIIGHRGAAGLLAENTLPSFQRALDLGCTALELDVHCVGETLAVIHDKTLDRTTDRKGPVAELSPADLASTDAGGASIPTLAEVFDLVQQHANHTDAPITEFLLNVELKGAGTAAVVADFLSQRADKPRLLVSSFDHQELRTFRQLDSLTPVAPLYDKWRTDWQQTATDLHATAVNLGWRICTQRRVQKITQAGFELYAYTVNRKSIAQRLASWGVTGIFTDRPDRFL